MNDNGQPNPPVINIAEASLIPLPNGLAVARFTVMGAFAVEIAFPASVVEQFMKQLLAMKQEQARMISLAGHIQSTKRN